MTVYVPTTVENCGTVTNSNDGSAATNPQDPATITVKCGDIGIDKTPTRRGQAGDQVGYTITVTNGGDGRRSRRDRHRHPAHQPGLAWTGCRKGNCSISAPTTRR